MNLHETIVFLDFYISHLISLPIDLVATQGSSSSLQPHSRSHSGQHHIHTYIHVHPYISLCPGTGVLFIRSDDQTNMPLPLPLPFSPSSHLTDICGKSMIQHVKTLGRSRPFARPNVPCSSSMRGGK